MPQNAHERKQNTRPPRGNSPANGGIAAKLQRGAPRVSGVASDSETDEDCFNNSQIHFLWNINYILKD